ncbi:MAG TPA: DUF1906 domain-containing protein [Gaiellaceae bacterium]|nr:DUF1906 domain-containing protein [Gaiellaceae bacterium]
MRGLGVLAVAALLFLPTSSNAASTQARVGVYTGYAFDACSAPSSNTMNAWLASPYRALGIYIGGANRACKQTNLTSTWVESTLGLGWKLLPLYVGLQAPCVSQSGLAKLSTNATTAAAQGKSAATDAASEMTSLGLPVGSPVWFDMEGYRLNDASCTKGVQSFVNGWDLGLHSHGYLAGVYGSAASTIRDIAKLTALPDLVWIANWNGVESVFGDPNVNDELWSNHQRIHQYKGGHKETYAGVTIDIDSNVVDSTVVGGTAPPPPPPVTPPAGQVNSGDGLATASWPAAAFATEVVVTLTPMATPPTANGYGVQLTVTETDNNAPVAGFGAPVTVHLLKPPVGVVPAFSTDGVTWTPLPQLTSAGLSNTVLSAYSVDADGTIEIQTLVPGYFGLIADTTPPTAPVLSGTLRTTGLYLSWTPSTDAGGVASYSLLKNGAPIQSLPATARRVTVKQFGGAAQTVWRVEATDSAGNISKASGPVVVQLRKRPAGIPRAVPQWAFALDAYQHHQGPRPKAAPKKPPAWYWLWAGWRAMPYKLR